MQIMKVGDRLRTSLTGSETVVRVEGTQIWGQVRVCQWKVHACGESGCTSVALAEHSHLY